MYSRCIAVGMPRIDSASADLSFNSFHVDIFHFLSVERKSFLGLFFSTLGFTEVKVVYLFSY